ncbi:MAG: putative DNA binding domain-containing protein [Tannerellaceae bacterium]|jgi:ATP-dependent DNA helicase RecG|nr:putative DNA binding domain-containing protein [Tannerellaceae bacterium]
MISKIELENILADTESYHAERTASTSDMDKFCQAICAFSNDLSGSAKNGYLILGAYNNGELSGLKVDDRLLLQISNIRTDGNILPQPVMTVEKFSFDKGDLLVVEVQPSEIPPVRYRGRIWVRVGPRKSFATEAEEKILTERRLSNIRTFDAMPCIGTTLADLDVSVIRKEFLPRAVAEDILSEDRRNLEEQLSSLGFYDLRYNCPTCGAIVLFALNPERHIHGSYVQYVRFKGKDKTGDILHEFKFSGNLCRALMKIDNFVETSVAAKRPIPVSVLREDTFSKYPYWATRELLMNAVMHRDYESNAPIQFYEYDDRIEVQNPGGLYGKVHPDNFPNVNDYRNPFIAEAMKILGYVNRFSRGVNRVQRELRENGNGEAVFDFSLITAFKVVEKISHKYFELGFGSEDNQENGETTPKFEGTTPITTPKPEVTTREKILDAIKDSPSITREDLAEMLQITVDGVKYHLQDMRKKGIIKHIGKSRGGKWVIV